LMGTLGYSSRIALSNAAQSASNLYAKDLDECASIIERDLCNIVYELPVGYPVEEDTIDT